MTTHGQNGGIFNKLSQQLTSFVKDVSNEARLLGSKVERTLLPRELQDKIRRVEALYRECEKSKALIGLYLKGPIKSLASLETSINNLSGFNGRDHILSKIGHCVEKCSSYSSPQFSNDFKSMAKCFNNLDHIQSNLYDRLPEFMALFKENVELKENMDTISEELSTAMQELDIARSSSNQNIDLIAEKARIYENKLSLIETISNARYEAHSQYALHLKTLVQFFKEYHEQSLQCINEMLETNLDIQ